MSTASAQPRAHTLSIAPDGTLRFLWDDALAPLLHEGEATIRRVSQVEPVGVAWVADLKPVGGPRLGPFPLRGEALVAEADWLLTHSLGAHTALPDRYETKGEETR